MPHAYSLDKTHIPIYLTISILLSGCAYLAYQSLIPFSLTPHIWTMASFIGCGFLIYTYRKSGDHINATLVMVVATAMHIIACIGQPFMEDDYFRYLWDGYQFYETGTPYGIPPSDHFSNTQIDESFQVILDQINYPDIPTIYAPVLQYVFLLNHILFPGDVNGLQTIFSLFNLGLIFLLLKQAPASQVMLYAWNPLVIKEIAFTTHPDGLGALLLFAASLCIYRQWLLSAAVLMALALASKILALLVLPFFVFNSKPKHWLVFIVSLFLIYLPFIIQGSSDALGLSAFAQNWQYNAAFYALLKLFLPETASKLLLLGLFSLGYFAYLFHTLKTKQSKQMPRFDLIIAGFLLISPVINVWYWLWLLPFAVLFPSRWAWGACALLSFAYWNGLYLEIEDFHPYQQLYWSPLIQFIGIAVLFLIDCLRPWTTTDHLRN